MSITKFVFIIIIVAAFFPGCVSTKKYDESLYNAYTLKTEKARLEEELFETSQKLGKEISAREKLETELVTLKSQKAELIRSNKSLIGATRGLNDTIAKLSQESLDSIREKDAAMSELKKTYNNLVSELNDEIKKGEIEVTQLRDKLTLSMVEKILFDSGRADIKQNGKAVLDRVAGILGKVTDKQIRIEGHTDNVPIGPFLAVKFPTNWELSTARSTTVVRYLQEKGVDPSFLSAAGYSEYRPIGSNNTEEERAKNRRIEIVLIPLENELVPTE